MQIQKYANINFGQRLGDTMFRLDRNDSDKAAIIDAEFIKPGDDFFILDEFGGINPAKLVSIETTQHPVNQNNIADIIINFVKTSTRQAGKLVSKKDGADMNTHVFSKNGIIKLGQSIFKALS